MLSLEKNDLVSEISDLREELAVVKHRENRFIELEKIFKQRDKEVLALSGCLDTIAQHHKIKDIVKLSAL
jgi:hypothetical protein